MRGRAGWGRLFAAKSAPSRQLLASGGRRRVAAFRKRGRRRAAASRKRGKEKSGAFACKRGKEKSGAARLLLVMPAQSLAPRRTSALLLPPPPAGEGWGGGRLLPRKSAPIPAFPRKRGKEKSGAFACKRGKEKSGACACKRGTQKSGAARLLLVMPAQSLAPGRTSAGLRGGLVRWAGSPRKAPHRPPRKRRKGKERGLSPARAPPAPRRPRRRPASGRGRWSGHRSSPARRAAPGRACRSSSDRWPAP